MLAQILLNILGDAAEVNSIGDAGKHSMSIIKLILFLYFICFILVTITLNVYFFSIHFFYKLT